MTSYWYCTVCVAGSTENAAATLAQDHTKRTQHATMTTMSRTLWLKEMQRSAEDRRGEK